MQDKKVIISEVYSSWRDVPFVWSKTDCLSFVGAITEALTGVDPTVASRARYSSEYSSKRFLVEEGCENVGDLAALLGREIHTSQATNGDWAFVVDDEGHDSLGVICGPTVAVKAEHGVGQVPRSRIKRAFRIE